MPQPILHLITNFSARGGAETMLARLISASPQRPAILVSLRQISDDNRSLISHPKVRFVALGGRTPLDLITAGFRVRTILREVPPTAMICWMYHAHVVGSVAARLAGYRGGVYWNVRTSLGPEAYIGASTKLALAAGAALRGWTDGMIFNSERAIANHAALGYRHSNTRVLPNGYILPVAPDFTARIPAVFGIAARFHPEKDYETFLACAGQVLKARPDARLIVAGRGAVDANPEFGALLDRFAIDRARTTLMDELTDMSTFYRAIDIMVLSSRMEGFPNVIAEAMSYGIPCVSTDVGDAGHIIGGTGRTVPPCDPNALAARLLEVMATSPETYAAMRKAARTRILEHFEISSVARRYDDFVLTRAA